MKRPAASQELSQKQRANVKAKPAASIGDHVEPGVCAETLHLADVHGDDSPLGGSAPKFTPLPAGPTSLLEAFGFAHDMVSRVCADDERLRRLNANLSKYWRVSSDYSGLRTEEVAFQALQFALQKHLKGQGTLKHGFDYSCDSDSFCQCVALGTDEARKPLHVFKDLNNWLTPSARSTLDQIEDNMPVIEKGMAPAERKEVAAARVEAYNYMGHYLLDNIEDVFQNKCECLQHLGECHLDFFPCQDGEERFEVAGLTCVAFALMGKHEGHAHSSMRPFFLWACLMRRRKPILQVIESAERFPKDTLQFFLGDLYHLQFFQHPGPCMHGWPITRPRMYCLAFLRSKVTFLGSEREYHDLFAKELKMDGDDLFFLPFDHAEVKLEKQTLARRRGVQLKPGSHPRWEGLYSAGKQQLIKQHTKLAAEKGSSTYVCDLDHNIGFMSAGTNWPCLVRHGTVFSLKLGRHATPTELFAAQGFPMDLYFQDSVRTGFQDFFEKDRLTSDSWHKMIGNAMFVPTLTSMILYALCSSEYHAAKIIRPISRYIEDSDGEE